MKLTINFLFLLATTVLLSCNMGGSRISGTGPIIEDTRMLTAVNEVVLDGSMRVELRAADVQSIIVYAQAEVQPVLMTNLKGETLTITTEGNVSMGEGTYVSISLPMLKSVTNDGSGSIAGGGFSGDKLSVTCKGSGSVTLDELVFDDYSVKLSGSGDAELAGRGKKLDVETGGSGDIKASELVVDKAKATTKGSGSISVAVGGDLKAKITGSGSITYKGSPKVDLEDSGSGELKGSN
ncbi:MAG: head GIN domain-containing protein [Saprospiraceae bacterium]